MSNELNSNNAEDSVTPNPCQSEDNSHQSDIIPLLDLCPKDNVNIDGYRPILNQAFDNKNIKNIAVTGPYGVGKSSIIRSFEKTQKLSFIYVSIAPLDANKKTRTTKNNLYEDSFEATNLLSDENVIKDVNAGYENKNTKSLEVGILTQILCQIKSEDIPASSFYLKADLSAPWTSNLFTICSITCIAYLILYLFFSESLIYDINYRWIYYSLFVGAFIGFISWVYKIQHKIHELIIYRRLIKKLTVAGNELLLTDDKDSVFDNKLSEIIYIFSKINAPAVVIEDIDRYGNLEIYERLRHLNLLVNNARKTTGKGPIKFIYAIDDSLFNRESRVKFFDVIIPVIPIAQRSDIFDEFQEILMKQGVLEAVDEVLLRRISMYVDDQRIFNNIVNEFLLYLNKLIINGTNGKYKDVNKLLAAVSFKNLFPRSFYHALNKRGYVHMMIFQSIREGEIHHKKTYGETIKHWEQEELDDFRDLQRDEKVGFLNFIVTKGFFREDYLFYISTAESDGLSDRDANFLKSIDLNYDEDFSYAIDNPEYVLFNLQKLKRFGSLAVLNFDLMDFMLTSEKQVAIDSIENFKNNIKTNLKEFPDGKFAHNFYEFVNLYRERNKHLDKFNQQFHDILCGLRIHNFP